jgi:hypothetical protein
MDVVSYTSGRLPRCFVADHRMAQLGQAVPASVQSRRRRAFSGRMLLHPSLTTTP